MVEQIKVSQSNKHQKQKQQGQHGKHTLWPIASMDSKISYITDSRPEAVIQRRQQEIINNSPQVQKATATQFMIDNSSRTQAENKRLDSLFWGRRQKYEQKQNGPNLTVQRRLTGSNNFDDFENKQDTRVDKIIESPTIDKPTEPIVSESKKGRGDHEENPNGINYEFDGPLLINDAVHENITLKSLQKACLANNDDNVISDSVWEYMRGVIWNDDPEGLLFNSNHLLNYDWSTGIDWMIKFKKGEKRGQNGEILDKSNSSLTERSHFGDLQFIHSMASSDGELPTVTKDKVMMWAEFTYKVAIGEIPVTTKIPDIPIAGIVNLFKGTSYTEYLFMSFEKPLDDCTLQDFFHLHFNGNIQQRSIGSLLHLIQDSFAEGHVERELIGKNRYGAIKSFHSYSQQDHEKHKDSDGWKESEWENMDQRLAKVNGAPDAIDVGANILKYYSNKTNWNTVNEYLNTVVFILSPDATSAGPGEDFKR